MSDESGLTCTLGAESATMEWSNSGTIADGRYEGALFVLASEFLSANGSGTPLLCPAGFGTVSSASTAETLTITSPV